jgi:hypothetical protein
MILREDELAQPGELRLRHRHAQHHALLLERDDEQVELVPGDLLRLDVDHAAHAVGRIDDEIALLERQIPSPSRDASSAWPYPVPSLYPALQRYRDPPRTLPCVLGPIPYR